MNECKDCQSYHTAIISGRYGEFCNRNGASIPFERDVNGSCGPEGRFFVSTALRSTALLKRENRMNRFGAVLAIGLVVGLAACDSDANVASRNLSKAADQFEISRRVVFYNGITDSYMLTIEGLCSLGNFDSAKELTVTCKTGPSTFKKHYLGLSDNVTYFVEQLEPAQASTYHYRVVFKPSVVIPDIEVR